MQGLMMDYPLTLDRIVEHAGRLYSSKRIRTKLPGGAIRIKFAQIAIFVIKNEYIQCLGTHTLPFNPLGD